MWNEWQMNEEADEWTNESLNSRIHRYDIKLVDFIIRISRHWFGEENIIEIL